jgi:hypothetical protein
LSNEQTRGVERSSNSESARYIRPMRWRTTVNCNVCKIAFSSHVLIWYGREPAEPGKWYAFRCPLTSRLQLVEASKHKWELSDERIARSVRIELHEDPQPELLDFDPPQPY